MSGKFEDKFVAVGKVFPVQPRSKATPPKGIKVCQFQVNSDKLVDFDTGVIMWKRDVEDVLNGRAEWAYAYVGKPEEVKAEPQQIVRKSR